MKKIKRFVDNFGFLAIYLAVSSYLIYSNKTQEVLVADQKLFLILSMLSLGIGFFSFFSFEKIHRIAGLLMMVSTIVMTSLYLFI